MRSSIITIPYILSLFSFVTAFIPSIQEREASGENLYEHDGYGHVYAREAEAHPHPFSIDPFNFGEMTKDVGEGIGDIENGAANIIEAAKGGDRATPESNAPAPVPNTPTLDAPQPQAPQGHKLQGHKSHGPQIPIRPPTKIPTPKIVSSIGKKKTMKKNKRPTSRPKKTKNMMKDQRPKDRRPLDQAADATAQQPNSKRDAYAFTKAFPSLEDSIQHIYARDAYADAYAEAFADAYAEAEAEAEERRARESMLGNGLYSAQRERSSGLQTREAEADPEAYADADVGFYDGYEY